MTARVEFQQGLFDEPFNPAEIRSANLIAAYLPDHATLAIERGMTGIVVKVALRITAATSFEQMPLGDEHDVGVAIAEELGIAVRLLGGELP